MKTKHEKIIRREDGSRVKIIAHVFEYTYSSSLTYRVTVMTCEKGKRTWRGTVDSDNYQYRALSMPEREEYEALKQLEVVTPDEILEAKLELWQKLSPTNELEDK